MKRLPVIALVGRPNVGKSTLFNRLTRSRDAIVADVPGLTRDRQYGRGRIGDRPFIVIDTGGFEPESKSGISAQMARQARQAVIESDCVIFVCDARAGLTGRDREIAAELRKTASKLVLALNKAEGLPVDQTAAEFHQLGLAMPVTISAAHGEGVRELIEDVLDDLGRADPDLAPMAVPAEDDEQKSGAEEPLGPRRLSVAVVGRPNVGKSTLINTLLGEERLIAFDQPGTTRDSVAIDFDRGGKLYTLIDTAGLRRRGKVTDTVEKFSMIKTLQAIEDCNVCILMLDAGEEIADQDATIAGHVLEAGRAVVLAVNKWDVTKAHERDRLKSELDRKMHFLSFAESHFISAREGRGIGPLMRSVDAAFASAMAKMPTPKLTRMLQAAVERQTPPRRGVSRPKLRYAHQGGQNPPIVVIHGSGLSHVPEAYRRYLESWFRNQFKLTGTPMRVEFRSATNPYAKS